MSTPELEQAIAASKWRGAEKNLLEIIAKMLEVDEALVARVVFAWTSLRNKRLARGTSDEHDELFDGLGDGNSLPEDVRSAITQAAALGWHRAAIRQRMERGLHLEVPFKVLVPANRPDKICNGCVFQLECVRDGLSTPKRCLDGALTYHKVLPDNGRLQQFQHSLASVVPVKLGESTVVVTAEHPRGTYTVSVMDVHI